MGSDIGFTFLLRYLSDAEIEEMNRTKDKPSDLNNVRTKPKENGMQMKKMAALVMIALMISGNAFAMGFWDSTYQKCNSKVYSICKSKGEGSAAYTQCVNDETNKCSCAAFKRPLGIQQGTTYVPYNNASGNPYTCS